MFKPVDAQISFAEMERGVLAFWEEQRTFEKSIENRRGGRSYVFYDGPPFATGLPHYGHLLAGTIKDVVPRYQTMAGACVERAFGWDCHGLPIEALAQEVLGLAGAPAIKACGVEVFNEQCRSMVLRYVGEWRTTVSRMGRWVDFDHGYKTMDRSFMETIWWVFKQLWEQGRIYRAHRIMPYSWKLNTPLSNFEANRNYQDVQDPAVTCRLRVRGSAAPMPTDAPVYLLIWTTTPWTLPENLAVCVGPDIDYVAVRDRASGDVYVLAESRLETYYREAAEYEVVVRFKGRDLAGTSYEPLFPYFAEQPGAFVVLTDGFVSTTEGTGIVHMAPAYGEDDYRVCRAAGIDLVDPLNEDAVFTDRVPDFAGLHCKDADKGIIAYLKKAGTLVQQSTIMHSYPFCERTDTPLIYRAIEAWYVRVEDLRERLLRSNAQIRWMPPFVGERRFANWLAEAKDWNISRNRFWGSCIPVWINEADPQDMICVGSSAELEELSGQKVGDLHKHFIDPIVIRRDGKVYRRTPEVLDCWFESGAMPYAQHHYPFENREKVEASFPADFIAEGLDQTRGWFYTLVVIGTALFDQPPFRNVVVNGLVLAEDGRKMSKRLKNYPDPMQVMNEYGADALRLCLLSSPVVKAEDLRFSEGAVREVMRTVILPLWNAYSFLVTYARVDGWEPSAGPAAPPAAPGNALDLWVLSQLEACTRDLRQSLDGYDLQRASTRFVSFIEDLTNWYIRRSRRRFWKSTNDADKVEAYQTLHYVLVSFCKLAAPFIPFVTDSMYRNLRTAAMPESVHLCDYPTVDGVFLDEALNRKMANTMSAVSLGRFLRTQSALKIRQPLQSVVLVSVQPAIRAELEEMAGVIAEELNVKEVRVCANEEDLVHLSAKANFKRLGSALGRRMRAAAVAIEALPPAEIGRLRLGARLTIDLGDGGAAVEIVEADILVQRQERAGMTVANAGDITVALDTTLSEALVREGWARDLVSRLQNLRKEAGLEVTDRIAVTYQLPAAAVAAVREFAPYIGSETLAVSLEPGELPKDAETEINGELCRLVIAKVPARV
jgi:isoleucyl-tRNA synthetase